MKMIAKAIEGKEYLYIAKTAHKVSARSADRICEALNQQRYQLSEGQIWHVYDMGDYEKEHTAAGYLSFCIKNGYLCEKNPATF